MPSQPLLSESQIQQSFIKIVRELLIYRYPDLRWLHSIPNGLRCSMGTAQKAKREGLTAGIADVFLPLPKENFHGLYLEFKKKGGYQSEAQKRFQFWCAEKGYDYHVVRDAETAIQIVKAYVSLPSPIRYSKARG